MELSMLEFEARCRQVVDEALARHEEVLLTHDGRVVARLIPIEDASRAGGSLYGRLAGSVRVYGDLVAPTGEDWDADV